MATWKRGKNFTFLHFKAEKMSKSTILRTIQRADNSLGSKRRIEIGKKPKIMDTKGKRKLKIILINQTNFHKHKQPDHSNILSNIYAKHLRSILITGAFVKV